MVICYSPPCLWRCWFCCGFGRHVTWVNDRTNWGEADRHVAKWLFVTHWPSKLVRMLWAEWWMIKENEKQQLKWAMMSSNDTDNESKVELDSSKAVDKRIYMHSACFMFCHILHSYSHSHSRVSKVRMCRKSMAHIGLPKKSKRYMHPWHSWDYLTYQWHQYLLANQNQTLKDCIKSIFRLNIITS